MHFIPAGIYGLRYVLLFAGDIVSRHWLAGEPLPYLDETRGAWRTYGFGILDQYWEYLESFSLILYLIMTLRLYNRYRQYIRNHFSNLEHIDFIWLRNFLIVNLIGIAIWISFNLANLILPESLFLYPGLVFVFFS